MALVDWADLPPDMLYVISQKLPIISDYASFRSVCKSWRSTVKPAHLPQQFPWLMLPPKLADSGWIDLEAPHEFFSLSENRLYRIDLPETHGKVCYSAGHGWLLVVGIPEMFLLKPLTRARIPLPPTTTFPHDVWNPAVVEEASNWMVIHAVLSADPATSTGWVVMVCLNVSWKLAFCRRGDRAWSVVYGFTPVLFYSVTYFNGKFYALSSADDFYDSKGVFAIDVSTSRIRKTLIAVLPSDVMGHYNQIYLVEAAGELFVVGGYAHCTLGQGFFTARGQFDVIKIDIAGKKKKRNRSKFESVDDQALFLSFESSLAVSARDSPVFCKPSCIYCPHLSRQYSVLWEPVYMVIREEPDGHEIGVFSIKDASSSFILCCPYYPHLWWKPAAWILPSLC